MKLDEELHALTKRLLEEEQKRKNAENELVKLRKLALETQNDWQDKHLVMKEINRKGSSLSATGFQNTNALRETQSSQRSLLAKICEEGKIKHQQRIYFISVIYLVGPLTYPDL